MWPLRCAEAGERRDLLALHGADRCDAGARRPAVDVHGAGAALGEAAAELRVVERQVGAQRVEQRHGRLGSELARFAVDDKANSLAHGTLLSARRGA
jgi:hypothetical protein